MDEGSDTATPAEKTPRQIVIEVLLVFTAVTFLCAVFYQLKFVVPFFRDHHQIFIAALFLFVPTEILIRRNASFNEYGLSHRPLGKGLAVFAVASLVVFPLFGLGFYLYYQHVCSAVAAGQRLLWGLVPAPRQYVSLCRSFVQKWRWSSLRIPAGYWEVVLGQLVAVGLTEEYFFRGYIQTRLEHAWPSRRRLLGAPVGRSLVVASLLFALGHLLVDFNGLRLAVFFPGLVFGWMRNLTGSILAGVLFHALANLVSDVLHRSFLF